MIDARFVHMPYWTHHRTPHDQRRSKWTFKAGWDSTLDLLHRELDHLEATDIVIGCGLREKDIRQDGWPRSNANVPPFPGVEVSFKSDVNLTPEARAGRYIIERLGGETEALKATHPDAGGDPADFVAVQAALNTKRLVYATDVCAFWQHNVRSIALGLEALRAVDRYGISSGGQQYAGFAGYLTAGVA